MKTDYITTTTLADKTVALSSDEATQPFRLNDLDLEFIEQDILETNATDGELECIVDEGLINVKWVIL